MNLENQRVTNNNQVTVTDSLNAALIELSIIPIETTIEPSSNDLIVYVDKQSKENPSEERKEYLFELSDKLRYANNVADEFKQYISIKNNDVFLNTEIKRKLFYNTETEEVSELANIQIEEIEGFPITLFEGENYIYTNYDNINIELIYHKNTLENKVYLNNNIFYNHKLKNDGEFCLDDIYFKDAFTKTGNSLNLEVNNANIDTLSSINDKFSLDSNGNLVVNTITCNQINSESTNANPQINTSDICNLIYPVGSLYLTVQNVSPQNLFGGTWEQITSDAYLKIVTTNAGVLNGTSSEHKIPTGCLPSHNHIGTTESAGAHIHHISGGASTQSSGGSEGLESFASRYATFRTIENAGKSSGAHSHSFTTSSVGEDTPYYPYYMGIYVWKRTE